MSETIAGIHGDCAEQMASNALIATKISREDSLLSPLSSLFLSVHVLSYFYSFHYLICLCLFSNSTSIGFGSSRAGTSKAHGEPLGPKILAEVKSSFGFNPEESFAVGEEVRARYSKVVSSFLFLFQFFSFFLFLFFLYLWSGFALFSEQSRVSTATVPNIWLRMR
jgi:hypothetical protein